MNAPILTLFNNKGGVGKTSLAYHLAWMMSDMGRTVLVCDLDPQANLTAAFLDEDCLAELWNNGHESATIYKCVEPLTEVGDLKQPELQEINKRLYLLAGDLALSGFEDLLSNEWPNAMGSTNLYRPFRILTAFWQVAQLGAKEIGADIIIFDVGPNLGAINRSALISTDYVLVPLAADLFSLQGLRNLGPTLRRWRTEWRKRLDNWQNKQFSMPKGEMAPIGYIVQQHSVRLTRPVKAYDRWMNRIPNEYRESVLDEKIEPDLKPADDPYCLATLKHYRSLVALAQEARKPIFRLTAADGAIGSHSTAVKDASEDFRKLTNKVFQNIRFADIGIL